LRRRPPKCSSSSPTSPQKRAWRSPTCSPFRFVACRPICSICNSLLEATQAGSKLATALRRKAHTIGELAALCQSAVVAQEDRAALAAFQARFGSDAPDMVVPGRKLLLESELFKQCRKAPKPYTFFLLSDAIVYAVAAGGESRLKFHQILRFRQNRVRVTDAFSTDPQRPFAFKVISTLKSFVVYAPNIDVKNHWIAAVRDALTKIDATDPLLGSQSALEPVPGTDASPVATPRDSNAAKAEAAADDPESAISPRLRARRSMAEQAAAAATPVDSAPVWIADAESNECLLCHAAFTFTKRRHHCRKCGKLVCAKCSSRTLDLGPELGRKARACEQCYNAVHASGQAVERSALVLESLGSNLLEFVLSFLSTRDLTAAARVSKRWNATVARDSLWLASYRRLLLRGDLDLDATVAAHGAELDLLRLSDTFDAAPAVGHTPRSRRGAPSRADDEALAAAAAARPVTIVALSLGGHVAPLPAGVPAGDLKRCFVELLRSTRKWRLADSHRPRLRVLRGHTAAVTVLAINPVAGRLFSGSLDCDIKQWDVFRAEPMAHDSQLLCAHANPVTALVGDWSSGASSISAASNVAAAAAAAAAANVADDDDPSTRAQRRQQRARAAPVQRRQEGHGRLLGGRRAPRQGDRAPEAVASCTTAPCARSPLAGGGAHGRDRSTTSDAAFNSDGGDVRSSSRADRLLVTCRRRRRAALLGAPQGRQRRRVRAAVHRRQGARRRAGHGAARRRALAPRHHGRRRPHGAPLGRRRRVPRRRHCAVRAARRARGAVRDRGALVPRRRARVRRRSLRGRRLRRRALGGAHGQDAAHSERRRSP
jgi:hypothetical protein